MRDKQRLGIYEVSSATGELPDVLHVAGGRSFSPVQFMVVLRPESWDVIVRGPLLPRSPDDSRQWGWMSWQVGLPQRVREIVVAEALREIEGLEIVLEGLRAGVAVLVPAMPSGREAVADPSHRGDVAGTLGALA